MFSLRAKTRRQEVSNGRGAQNGVCVEMLWRTASTPACALAGLVAGGHVPGSVCGWDHGGESDCRSLCPRVIDNEREKRRDLFGI